MRLQESLRHWALSLAVGALWACASLAQAADPAPGKPAPGKPAGGAALLQLDDGRSGRGNLIATTGIRGFGKPATASAHALIMTIGDYPSPVPKLAGVRHDSVTATDIARRMGVPPANIRVLRDGELTLQGMRRAFDELESRLGGDDQVFIYFSGHGGRQLVKAPDGDRCAESLITADADFFTDVEMEERIRRLNAKSQKTVVFLDACHSGGMATRSLGAAGAAYTPKSYTAAGQNCSKPSNVLTRSMGQAKPAGSGGNNLVYIAAARDSEVSLDQPGRGGVATQAWQACLAGAARDADGSGGLSVAEIQGCAQERINRQLLNVQGFLPHHVSVTGNPAMVLSYAFKESVATAAAPEPSLPAASAATAPASVDSAPAVTVTPAPASAAVKPAALAALMDIYNSRDDRRLLSVEAPRTTLKIGRDSVDFTLTSREGGHVYLLMVGSDGKAFDLLFPNQLDRNNLLAPSASMRLPRPSWQLSAEGPPGSNTLLAIVTDSPRDFGAAGLKPSGPFSSVNAVAAKDIQLVTVGAEQMAKPECAAPASTRNLSVQKRCSSGYAAALLTIEEVR